MSEDVQAPEEEVSFDDFSKGLGINRLPSTDKLQGREFPLFFGGNAAGLSFDGNGQASWHGMPLSDGLDQGKGEVDVIEAGADLFYIEALLPRDRNQGLIVILDLQKEQAIAVNSILDRTRHEQGHASNFVQYFHGASFEAGKTVEPEVTRELIGRRYLNTYSDDMAVEHIYINSQWYAYHILGDIRYGDADCDEISYFKLREGVYLVACRETAMDVAITFIINTQDWRNTGVAQGAEEAVGGWFSVPLGAYIEPLAASEYPAHQQPI